MNLDCEIKYIGKRPPPDCFPGKYKNNIERIIAGKEMDHHKRLTWPPTSDPWPYTTGSIGFLDFIILENKKTEEPYVYFMLIGIEPQHRKKGYAIGIWTSAILAFLAIILTVYVILMKLSIIQASVYSGDFLLIFLIFFKLPLL